MATFKYFSDINGEAIELSRVWHDGSASTKAAAFTGVTPEGERVRATRMIEMKARPSRHECDARCINATGRVMKCECSCGGKNHGRGAFHCSAVAA